MKRHAHSRNPSWTHDDHIPLSLSRLRHANARRISRQKWRRAEEVFTWRDSRSTWWEDDRAVPVLTLCRDVTK